MLSVVVALPVLLLASGCGSSGSSSSSHTSSTAARTGLLADQAPQGQGGAHLPSIGVATGARAKNAVIWPRYTCYGEIGAPQLKNISPQLSWKGLAGVLAGSQEQMIVMRTLVGHKVTTDWAVSGISPSVNFIKAGTVPSGAIVGRNSFGNVGYDVCPKANESALITIGVYALPHKLGLKPGFQVESLRGLLGSSEVQWGSVLLLFGKGKTPGP